MLRPFLLAILLATPLAAEDDHNHDHDHADHLSEAEGLRLIHGWTTATDRGPAPVYLEIENTRDSAVILTGAESEAAEAIEITGIPLTAGADPMTLPELEIAAGTTFDLTPESVYLVLNDLAAPLEEDGEIDVTLIFGEEEIELHVDVLEQGATQHPHAGHAH
ncbi:copper chaperone PCu(A)C [Aestuariibius sp. 2305UL40-4]|uniref:copper chaperone PCu(A)C n=1 Tax=Aestuariibius violaceus TaxID=3234132 RepID=UPI00345EA92F